MDYGIKGKVAVVTGASKGLARASALALAREGTDLVIGSRDAASIEAAAAAIRQETGVKVVSLAADVSTAEGCARTLQTAYDAFGRVDILVANAGGPSAGLFMNFTDDDWQKAYELTLMSTVRLVRGVLPGMRQQKWGRIVYISSGSIKNPLPALLFSNVFRSGVVQMLKTISREVAPDGVTVNNVAPGRMATERLRWLDETTAKRAGKTPAEIAAEDIALIPAGRYGTAEEYANAVAFICSEGARYLTGVTLQVDGGQNRFIY